MRKIISGLILTVLLCLTTVPAWALPQGSTRIKDVAKIQGVRSNQLQGYGLVVGLAGTGDSNKSIFAIQSVANMLRSYGVTVAEAQLQTKNVAAVIVTAQLPPFVKSGDTIDITVSSMGDAKSLQGGTLLQTPLKAGNGGIYAVGQGSMSLGGGGPQKTFYTVGTIPSGAIVERDVVTKVDDGGNITLALNQPDYTTASRVTDAILRKFGNIAMARDAGTVVIRVPSGYDNNLVGFIATLEDLFVVPDNIAKVVINERSGTIVMGGNVTIDTVAVAQGGLSIKVGKPDSSGNSAPDQNVILLPASSNVSDVVNALNAVGATAHDIIAILQAMKASGALHAELQMM